MSTMQPNSVHLTRRDEALLEDCYRNGVLSYAQIRSRHFPKLNDSTISNRLAQLKWEGYLTSQRIGVQIHHGNVNRIGVVFRVTKSAIRVLQAKYPERRYRDDPVPLNTASLSHDLLLTEALSALQKRLPRHEIVHGKLLSSSDSRQRRVPDAIIQCETPKARWAIELELTAKSSRRYREIILAYRLMPEFEKVLYVYSGNAIAEKIQTQILGYSVPWGTQGVSLGKFYFVTLNELLRTPETTRLSNGNNNLTTQTRAPQEHILGGSSI